MAVFMPMTSPAISTSGPPELPGLMAASVWMKRWNWLARRPGRLVDGAVLGGDDAGGDGLGEAEGAADGEHPVADLGAVGVAELDGGQGLLGVDLDDGDVGVLIDADDVWRDGRGRRGRRRDRWRASRRCLSALSTTWLLVMM